MDFILDNIGNIIVIVLVCLAVFFAVRKIRKDKKKGACSCGCESCALKDSCHKVN